jgi:hypothetical protein
MNMHPDGLISGNQHAQRATDQGIAEIFNPDGALSIKPNGQPSHTFTLLREFPFPNTEPGPEEYYVAVTVVPEIRGDVQFSSNEISPGAQ